MLGFPSLGRAAFLKIGEDSTVASCHQMPTLNHQNLIANCSVSDHRPDHAIYNIVDKDYLYFGD